VPELEPKVLLWSSSSWRDNSSHAGWNSNGSYSGSEKGAPNCPALLLRNDTVAWLTGWAGAQDGGVRLYTGAARRLEKGSAGNQE
jgi:hypothetical protein